MSMLVKLPPFYIRDLVVECDCQEAGEIGGAGLPEGGADAEGDFRSAHGPAIRCQVCAVL